MSDYNTYTIYVPETVQIPTDEIPRLEQLVREKWDMAEDEDVDDEDIITQAGIEGLIDLPENWTT